MNNNLTDRQTDLDNCAFVKTILMLIIVASHSMAFWRGGWFSILKLNAINPFLSNIVNWLSSFHVYSFTLVSGFIFYYVVYQANKYTTLGNLIRKKINRLLVPYIFVSLVWIIPFKAIFFKDGAVKLFEEFVLGTDPAQLWFLLMLFLVFVFSWLLKDIYINHPLWSAFIVVGFYGISIVGAYILPNYFGIWHACRHMVMFFIGFKICQYGGTVIFKCIPSVVLIIINLLIFILWSMFAGKSGIYVILDKGFEFALRIDGAVTAFVILERVGKILSWKDNNFFERLSNNSMGMYLFHQQIIYCTLYILYNKINTYCNVVINFIVALIVSLLISSTLHKWKWTRFFLGES